MRLRRAVDESGFVQVPWEVDEVGRVMVGSATLMERPQPYHLPLELARGKLNQVRCQAHDWQAGGLELPVGLAEQIHQASLRFGRAATDMPSEESARQAQAALAEGYRVADELVRVYTEQVFRLRHQRAERLDTALGSRLGSSVPAAEAAAVLRAAGNTVCLPLAWSDVEPAEADYRWDGQDALLEWAEGAGLRVVGGPLIDFSSSRLPGWLWMWERDLPSLTSFLCSYVQAVVRRYRGRIQRWQLTAASNCATVLSLGEDELLWLTVRLAEAARQVDPGLELVVGIAQPWGEYLAVADRVHSPFLFADTLVRSGLSLAALDVELVMGVTPRGSYCRDLLDTSRLLDLYALLGVPVQVTLGYPAAERTDADADPDCRVAGGRWRGGVSPEGQAGWAAAFATLAVCKSYVDAVYWTHARDGEPHQFPHCGLLDPADRPRPVAQPLAELTSQQLR
jgi:hypothetical protein